MRWTYIISALLMLGATGASANLTSDAKKRAETQQKLTKALQGLSPVARSNCISLRYTRGTERYGDTILYRANNKLVYRTDTSGGCFGLDRGDVIVTRTYSDQLCRGDIARTVDPVAQFETGSCSIGEFTTYKAP